MRLVALKDDVYGSRKLKAGEAFDASDRDAKILIALKRAKDPNAREPGKIDPPPARVVAKMEKAAAEPETREPETHGDAAPAATADAAPAVEPAPTPVAEKPAEHFDSNAEVSARNKSRAKRDA